MDELIRTFHIDASLLIAQVVNFLIVFVVLYFVAVKPLRKAVNKRQELISQGLSDATHNATLLEETKAHYDQALLEARKEAQQIIEQAKKSATFESAKIIKEAEDHSRRIAVGSKVLLDHEKEKMLKSAKAELAEIVINATEKVLEGTITKSIDASLVDKALREIKK